MIVTVARHADEVSPLATAAVASGSGVEVAVSMGAAAVRVSTCALLAVVGTWTMSLVIEYFVSKKVLSSVTVILSVTVRVDVKLSSGLVATVASVSVERSLSDSVVVVA